MTTTPTLMVDTQMVRSDGTIVDAPPSLHPLAATPEPARPLARLQPSERSDLANLLEAAKGGLPAETIATLVGLCHVEADRRARQEFNAAFAAFQRSCPMVPRTKAVDYVTTAGGRVHYSYAPLEEIIRTVQPHLDANDLSRSWDCDELTKPGNLIVTCTISHISGAERKSVAQGPIESPTKMSPMQKVNAARTTLQRTSLIGALGLVNCDDDPDGNEPGALDAGLSESQVETILNLLVETTGDAKLFAKSYGAEKVADIPAKCFEAATDRLNKLRNARGKK